MIKITALLLCALGASGATRSEAGADDTLSFERFGKITLYRGASEPRDVVLFLSGDGGWNQGVISMAQHLADKNAIVAGVDIRGYLEQLEKAPQACVSPAADLQNLSRYLQATLGLKRYLEPTLVGYSSGATLVYAALAEAPGGTFKGALSLGFCPDLDLKKPLCRGSGIEATPRRSAQGNLKGVDLLPAKSLAGKWISLQGELDEVCLAPAAQKFVSAVPGGEVIMLPKVGHGYSVEKNWVPQYEAAYDRIIAPQPAAN
jgi:type IV secretory pathway VirJ component